MYMLAAAMATSDARCTNHNARPARDDLSRTSGLGTYRYGPLSTLFLWEGGALRLGTGETRAYSGTRYHRPRHAQPGSRPHPGTYEHWAQVHLDLNITFQLTS